jgi:hypothetical protein
MKLGVLIGNITGAASSTALSKGKMQRAISETFKAPKYATKALFRYR